VTAEHPWSPAPWEPEPTAAGPTSDAHREHASERNALQLTPLAGIAFRVTAPGYRDFARTVAASCGYPQRFNTADVGAIYASREPDTAAREAFRRFARDRVAAEQVHPRSVFVLLIQLQAVLSLITETARAAWGITDDDLTAEPEMRACQEAATIAAQSGAEAIRWPSATGAGESIGIFHDRLRPGSHVDIIDTLSIEREWLLDLAAGVPVTHFLPALSDFPPYPST